MLEYHKEKDAACTIAMLEVPWEEASRFGLMLVDDENRITEFEEKPKNPRSNKASMGVYIFTWSKLRQYLIDDERTPSRPTTSAMTSFPPCTMPRADVRLSV